MLNLGQLPVSRSVIFVAALLLMTTSSVRAESAQSDPVVVILFMFFGLGTGILIMQVLSALGDPIPYTCVVFASGIIFSLAHKSNTGILVQIPSRKLDFKSYKLLITVAHRTFR